jgi:hypothetical protein
MDISQPRSFLSDFRPVCVEYALSVYRRGVPDADGALNLGFS